MKLKCRYTNLKFPKRVFSTAIIALIVSFQALGGGASESGSDDVKDGDLLKVVVTTNIIGDVVSNVGGDAIELTVLIKAGQDPHSFEPTPSTLAAVETAHIIFINGFDLEESLLDGIEAASKVAVIAVSEGIEPIGIGLEHGAVDPHVWFDPTNVIVWIDNIEKHLAIIDPSNREGYQKRAGEYRERLKNLDRSIRSQVESLPPDARKLVADHRVFGYFADEYGFEIIGTILPGFSTSADASARSISDLADLLKSERVFTIFVGSTAGRGLEKLAHTLASELGKGVRIISVLTGSLSLPGKPGDSYIGYMEYNISQMMKGLLR